MIWVRESSCCSLGSLSDIPSPFGFVVSKRFGVTSLKLLRGSVSYDRLCLHVCIHACVRAVVKQWFCGCTDVVVWVFLKYPNVVILNAVGRRNMQMSAKERKSANEKSAKEQKRALLRTSCKQPRLKQPGLGTPKSWEVVHSAVGDPVTQLSGIQFNKTLDIFWLLALCILIDPFAHICTLFLLSFSLVTILRSRVCGMWVDWLPRLCPSLSLSLYLSPCLLKLSVWETRLGFLCKLPRLQALDVSRSQKTAIQGLWGYVSFALW